jgi:hypothetical protein
MGIKISGPGVRGTTTSSIGAEKEPATGDAAPAPASRQGWLANATARTGRALSDGAQATQEWVEKNVGAMERASEASGSVAHFSTSFAGGLVDGLSGMMTGTVGLAGGALQLADAKTRADVADTMRQIAAQPGAVANALTDDVVQSAADNPGHMVGQIASCFTPGAVAKLAEFGRAGQVADGLNAAAKEAEGAKVADVAKVAEGTTPAPRTVEQILADLGNATTQREFAQSMSQISNPDDMRALADTFMKKATEFFPGGSPAEAREDAMNRLKDWAWDSRFAPRDASRTWHTAINVAYANLQSPLKAARPETQLMSALSAASPNNPYLEGLSTIRHPDEMKTLVTSWLENAPALMPTKTPEDARSSAMKSMRFWVNDREGTMPGTGSAWNKVFDEVEATPPKDRGPPTRTARSREQLVADLSAKDPKSPVIEGMSTVTHPDEMKALAQHYVDAAPKLWPGKTPERARATALANMRFWINDRGNGADGTEPQWNRAIKAVEADTAARAERAQQLSAIEVRNQITALNNKQAALSGAMSGRRVLGQEGLTAQAAMRRELESNRAAIAKLNAQLQALSPAS